MFEQPPSDTTYGSVEATETTGPQGRVEALPSDIPAATKPEGYGPPVGPVTPPPAGAEEFGQPNDVNSTDGPRSWSVKEATSAQINHGIGAESLRPQVNGMPTRPGDMQ